MIRHFYQRSRIAKNEKRKTPTAMERSAVFFLHSFKLI
jgi:hypothetical protein